MADARAAQTLLSVQDGRLQVSPGREPGQLHVPAELPAVVTVDGQRQTGAITLHGDEDVAVVLPAPSAASWSIGVARDGLTAWLEVKPGVSQVLAEAEPAPELVLALREVALPPLDLTPQALADALAAAGVTTGIDELAVAEAAGLAPAGRTILARGRAPVPGQDGRLEVLVQLLTHQPYLERPDGTVDFRDRPEIPAVEAGTMLARLYPPAAGQPGETVQGRELPARSGRPVAAVTGPGAEVSQEEGYQALVAVRSGRPVVAEQRVRRYRVDVVPVYTVQGNVDMSSGNVRFNGDVKVLGDVAEGFSVQAVGTITVSGSVYDADLLSAGGIVVKGAAMGSRLTVQGAAGVEVGRVHQSHIDAGDWLKVGRQGVYFSDLNAGGDVVVAGAVVGGTLQAGGTSVRLAEAGSRLGAETFIAVPAQAWVSIDLVHPGVKVRIGQRVIANRTQRRHWVVTEETTS